jgi:hypothetical protein
MIHKSKRINIFLEMLDPHLDPHILYLDTHVIRLIFRDCICV